MRKTNDTKNKKSVGAPAHRCPNKGITLIALIITIIVMLILVAVTITMAINGGLFGNAGKAVGDTKNAINKEQQLANGVIQICGKWYESIDDYLVGKEMEKWITIWEGEATTTDGEVLLSTTGLFKDGSTYRITVESEEYTGSVETMAVLIAAEDGVSAYALFVVKDGEAIGGLETLEDYEANIDENTTFVLGYNFTGEGSFMVFPGAPCDYKVTKIEELKRKRIINVTQSEGQDLWSSTVTFTILPGYEDALTLEQKKEIVAYMYDCSNYEEFKIFLENFCKKTYEEILEQVQMDEQTAIDAFIEIGKSLMSFKDIEKLESLGIEVISIKTPYDTTLYTTSLGGEVACTFIENGTYDFKIKSGTEEKTETITINNLRTATTQAPYSVNVELTDKVFKKLYPLSKFKTNLLYSVDDTNSWKELTTDTVIECNNAVYIKFADHSGAFTGGSTLGYGLHWVEKNDEYYKYFNEECPDDWLFIRLDYGLSYGVQYGAKEGLSLRQTLLPICLQCSTIGYTCVLRVYPRLPDFFDDFVAGMRYKIVGEDINFPEEIEYKYPELELGYDSVITWTGYQYENGVTESPVYKIDVTHDMSILLHEEIWD